MAEHFTRLTRNKIGELFAKNYSKNSKKTAQRMTTAIWRIKLY